MGKKFKIRLPRFKSFFFTLYTLNILLLIAVVSLLFLIFTPIVTNQSMSVLEQNFKNDIRTYSNTLQSNINKVKLQINILQQNFSKYKEVPQDKRRNYYTSILYETLRNSPEMIDIFTIWKPYGFDNLDDTFRESQTSTGQFGKWYFKNGNIIDSLNLSPQEYSLVYTYSKLFTQFTREHFYIITPIKEYSYIYGDTIVYARVLTAIRDNEGVIQGFTGFDVLMSYFLEGIPMDELQSIMLINQDLAIIYAPEQTIVGLKITSLYPEISKHEIFNYILRQIPFVGKTNFFGQKYFTLTYPILISNYNQWTIIKNYPQQLLKKFYFRFALFFVLTIIINIIIFSLILIGINALNNKHLRNIENVLDSVVKGKPVHLATGRIYKYTEFKRLKSLLDNIEDRLKKQIKFTEELAEGNLEVEPLELSSEDDLLNQALNKLAEQLKKAKEAEEQLRKEQELETWKSSGLAKFNDILRKNINDLDKLAYETISNLTDYLEAQVGAFFIFHHTAENQGYLELKGYYGYNRKIYEKKTIELGEGLSGTVALEQKPIITKVPDEYVELATGLGKAKPNYIAVYPLISANMLYGVIEIAKIDPFEDKHINFLEEISIVIASTLASAQVASETRRLLEESRRATEQMHAKELELEQTIKKIEQLREQSEEQRIKLESIVNALNEIVYYIEFSSTKKVLAINRLLLNILNISYAEATAKNYFDIFQIDIEELEKHKNYWKDLERGRKINLEMKLIVGEKTYWIKSVLVPVIKDMKLDRVLYIGIDITELKIKEQDVTRALVKLKEQEEQINVQKIELEVTMQELEEAYKKLDEKDEIIKQLEKQLEELKTMHETLAKEFDKRIKRHRKIEAAMREKIRLLEEEIEKLRGNKQS